MLQIKKLNLTHKKDLRIILNDFNLVLNDGDKAVIIGEEGNGKSTLMKWIYNPSLVENYIEADGERIMGHERLGYLPQEMLDEDKEKTIYEYFSEEEIFWEKTPKELSVITSADPYVSDTKAFVLELSNPELYTDIWQIKKGWENVWTGDTLGITTKSENAQKRKEDYYNVR